MKVDPRANAIDIFDGTIFLCAPSCHRMKGHTHTLGWATRATSGRRSSRILNNGNVRGLPVLRTMMNRQREFNPQAFHVFGPKIVATRGSYDDKGLESRFLTEEMGSRKLRSDIPINLPEGFKDEARELRNKLLLYRFHRRHEVKLDETLVDPKIEPRLNQILLRVRRQHS